MTDWPALASAAFDGLCLLAGLSLACCIALAALLEVDE